LNLRAGWKLAGAALMPGALLMTAGIGLYGLGAFDLVKFLAVGVAHIIVTWAYLFAAAFYTPKTPLSGPAAKNPFATPADDKAEGGPR
jgi:hypothetical protein